MNISRLWISRGAAKADSSLSFASAEKTGSSTGVGSVISSTGSATSENGTLYYLVSTNFFEPLIAIIAGESQSVTADGIQSVSFTGLTQNTSYYTHYVYKDINDNYSNIVVSNSFTTDAVGGGGFILAWANFNRSGVI